MAYLGRLRSGLTHVALFAGVLPCLVPPEDMVLAQTGSKMRGNIRPFRMARGAHLGQCWPGGRLQFDGLYHLWCPQRTQHWRKIDQKQSNNLYSLLDPNLFTFGVFWDVKMRSNAFNWLCRSQDGRGEWIGGHLHLPTACASSKEQEQGNPACKIVSKLPGLLAQPWPVQNPTGRHTPAAGHARGGGWDAWKKPKTAKNQEY